MREEGPGFRIIPPWTSSEAVDPDGSRAPSEWGPGVAARRGDPFDCYAWRGPPALGRPLDWFRLEDELRPVLGTPRRYATA